MAFIGKWPIYDPRFFPIEINWRNVNTRILLLFSWSWGPCTYKHAHKQTSTMLSYFLGNRRCMCSQGVPRADVPVYVNYTAKGNRVFQEPSTWEYSQVARSGNRGFNLLWPVSWPLQSFSCHRFINETALQKLSFHVIVELSYIPQRKLHLYQA